MSSVDATVGKGDPSGLFVRSRERSLIAFFVLIWGLNFLLAEVALTEVVPVGFSAARFLVGSLAGVFILWYRSRIVNLDFIFDSREKVRLGIAIVIGGVLAPWLGIVGLSLTHAGRAAIWIAMFPTISFLMGLRFRTEKIHALTLIAVGVTGFGAVLLSLDGWKNESGLGDLFLISAVILSVAELHLLRPLVLKHPPISIGMVRLIGGALLYGLVAMPWLVDVVWITLSPITWVAILGGGIVAICMGQWVQARANRVFGPTVLSIHYLAVPVVALIGGWIFLSTEPQAIEWIAGGVILGGVALLKSGD